MQKIFMKKIINTIVAFNIFIFLLMSCSKKIEIIATENIIESNKVTTVIVDPINQTFGSNIALSSLANYANQPIPAYITKDNGKANPITNIKATIGRVLFYDKNLSVTNSVSCGSCHKQEFAFGDTALVSKGVFTGTTIRHSTRLINNRFSTESKFFWDERAASLEQQTTMPIQDHAEMGFSGQFGRANLTSLLNKLGDIKYYNVLFKNAYGDTIVTEPRLQECLAQFVRSIQSFDSKYDIGRAAVRNNNDAFVNYTAQENAGKTLYMNAPIFDATGSRISGGVGCNGCHRAPEFDIDSNTRNNGIVGIINNVGIDVNNTRAPSLRDLTKANGTLNTVMMHTGQMKNLRDVINHYQNIPIVQGNNRLDNRLRPNGQPQKLKMTETEISNVIAFLNTLGGTNVYTDKKWSDPFLVK